MASKSTVDKSEKLSNIENGADFLSASSETSVSAPSLGEASASSESEIKGSKSWEPDYFNKDAWHPQNVTNVELTDKRFVARWVRDGFRSNVDKAMGEGYEFVTFKELKNINKARMADGTGLDSVVRNRDSVLMKLSVAWTEAKREYNHKQIVDPKTYSDAFRKSLNKDDAEHYGEGAKVTESIKDVHMPRYG